MLSEFDAIVFRTGVEVMALVVVLRLSTCGCDLNTTQMPGIEPSGLINKVLATVGGTYVPADTQQAVAFRGQSTNDPTNDEAFVDLAGEIRARFD